MVNFSSKKANFNHKRFWLWSPLGMSEESKNWYVDRPRWLLHACKRIFKFVKNALPGHFMCDFDWVSLRES